MITNKYIKEDLLDTLADLFTAHDLLGQGDLANQIVDAISEVITDNQAGDVMYELSKNIKTPSRNRRIGENKMSTRCNIIIKDTHHQVFLYHHHDGYPEGVGRDLYNRFHDKLENRNNRLSIFDFVNGLIKDQDDEYEWTDSLHGDIEYLYEIDLDKRKLECWAVDNWERLKYGEEYNLKEICAAISNKQ